MPAWLSYTLLRVGVFLGTLVVLLLLGLYWLWAALIATVIAFCVSYIFFRRQRLALAQQWAARRPVRTRDDIAEDEALDADASGSAGWAPSAESTRSARTAPSAESPRSTGSVPLAGSPRDESAGDRAAGPDSPGDGEGERRAEP